MLVVAALVVACVGLRTTAAELASRDKMEYCIRTFALGCENTN